MVSVDVKHNILLSIDHPSLSLMVSVDVKHYILRSIYLPSLNLMVSVDVKHHILLSIRSPVPKPYGFCGRKAPYFTKY